MLFLVALLLAIFVLPSPWGIVAVVGAAVLDIIEIGVGLWWSKRRKSTVGADTLVLAQCDLDDVRAVWASALTQERCGRALLALPELLLDCLVGLARHRLVFGDASLAILIHPDDPTPRTPCSPAPGGQPDDFGSLTGPELSAGAKDSDGYTRPTSR